ncbi:hypothetical protein Tco_0043843, partial [Tanacetum coccineum]
MDFSEFYKELEADFFGEGTKRMGLQHLQLELRLGKNPSRSFRPVNSAKILWQLWTSYSLRVSLAQDGSWSKWEPTLWLCADETVYEEREDSMERATTTAASL